MRYKVVLSYDGTNYHGYQRQKGKITIQEVLERTLKIIEKKEVTTYASGRTDAHVHALGQVFHFDSCIKMDEEAWKRALNSLLPKDIRVKDVKRTKDTFHARFDAISKEYHYYINTGEYNVFYENYMLQERKINVLAMEEAIKYFIGVHDFTSFSRYVDKKDTIREIYEAYIIKKGDILEIVFKGNGFLKYMVRIMIGALLDVGRLKRKPASIIEMFEAKNRQMVGKTASPNGLFLWCVNYERDE